MVDDLLVANLLQLFIHSLQKKIKLVYFGVGPLLRESTSCIIKLCLSEIRIFGSLFENSDEYCRVDLLSIPQ